MENHNWGLPLAGQIAITASAKCKKKSLRLSWRLRKGNAIHAGDLQGKMFLKWSLPTAQPTQIRSSLSSLSVAWDYWHLRLTKPLRMSTVIIDKMVATLSPFRRLISGVRSP